MDVVYVRTKLQALIALELIRSGEIGPRYTLVRMYQHAKDEDDGSVYRTYQRLSEGAEATWSEITGSGIVRSLILAWRAFRLAKRGGGAVYNANLTMVPLALAAKAVRGSRFRSFDDGFANIVPTHSPYFVETPLSGAGIKRRVLRWLLPRGAPVELRRRSEVHYTIFPEHPNVVEPGRLRAIALPWADYLTAGDHALLDRQVTAVLIGTKYDEWPSPPAMQGIVAGLADRIELYLPHPREPTMLHASKAVRLDAPAESAILFLARRNPLTVYHIDSSVALTLSGAAGVRFVNVAPDWKLADVPTLK